jgi:hypothetical protein
MNAHENRATADKKKKIATLQHPSGHQLPAVL